MKRKWTKPEIRGYRGTVMINGVAISSKAALYLLRHAISRRWKPPAISLLGEPETCADHCKADKCTALLLKDDPRCRIKPGG